MNKLIIILCITIIIQGAVSIYIQSIYSKALTVSQEDLACARINKHYVSVGNGLCFDMSLIK